MNRLKLLSRSAAAIGIAAALTMASGVVFASSLTYGSTTFDNYNAAIDQTTGLAWVSPNIASGKTSGASKASMPEPGPLGALGLGMALLGFGCAWNQRRRAKHGLATAEGPMGAHREGARVGAVGRRRLVSTTGAWMRRIFAPIRHDDNFLPVCTRHAEIRR